MKKATITVQVDETKLNTLKPYLKKKNISLDDELAKAVDNLYSKLVPAQVKEFFAMQEDGDSAKSIANAKSTIKGQTKENS